MKTYTQSFRAFAIMPPEGWSEDIEPSASVATTVEGAWNKFCYPALCREAYEKDGYRPVDIVVKYIDRNSHTRQ